MKEPWQMTPAEFYTSRVGDKWYVSNTPVKRYEEAGSKRINRKQFDNLEKEHKQIIQQALFEDKPVPSEVLTNYSDLEAFDRILRDYKKTHKVTIVEVRK